MVVTCIYLQKTYNIHIYTDNNKNIKIILIYGKYNRLYKDILLFRVVMLANMLRKLVLTGDIDT